LNTHVFPTGEPVGYGSYAGFADGSVLHLRKSRTGRRNLAEDAEKEAPRSPRLRVKWFLVDSFAERTQ